MRQEQREIVLVCQPGLADLLAKEVRDLGYDIEQVRDKGLHIRGSIYDTLRLNIHSRTCLYVLWLLKSFHCDGPAELYRNVRSIPWEQIIPADEYVSVDGWTDHASIKNSMFLNQKVKDALVDRIAKHQGSRPDAGSQRRNVVVNVFWKDSRCRVYLNTTGNKLSDRGYRKRPWQAPLQETLAAGIMQATGYTGEHPLVNPMCGSGTLAIEAALLAQQRAVGLLRSNLSVMHTKLFEPGEWQELRRDATKQKAKYRPAAIIASDIASGAVEAAQANARTAGVEHLIEFHVCDFADTPIPQYPGIILMNPEYGQRLGEENELTETYQRIGDFFKQQCAGYTGYIFTGNLTLAKKVGLRTSKRHVFFNGGIECRLLRYELYAGSKST